MIQLHAYFSGIVQGVGFRYTVQRYAVEFGVCGWVRNLPDGRVELKAEGRRSDLNSLLGRVQTRFEGSIRQADIFWDNHLEGFTTFRITF